jgi:hypothetical protein
VYYAALEQVGYESAIRWRGASSRAATRSDGAAAVPDHARALQGLTGFEGGELRESYRALSGELERCEARAGEVHERIAGIRDVAETRSTSGSRRSTACRTVLRRSSEQRLKQTRTQYQSLLAR